VRPVTRPTASRSDDSVATLPRVNVLPTVSDHHPTKNKTLSLAIYALVPDNEPAWSACANEQADAINLMI
jgi:hypothetical protein